MIESGQAVRRLGFRPPAGADAAEVLDRAALLRRFDAAWFRTPERLDFHLVVLTGARPGVHEVDFTTLTLAPHSALLLHPGQVHRFVPEAAFAATLVLIPDATAALGASAAWTPARPATVRRPDGHERRAWQRTVGALRAEQARVAHHGPGPALGLLARALLAQLEADAGPRAGSELFVAFMAALERDFRHERTVRRYAEALGYVPRTLDRACRDAVGLGAKALVDRRVALEAQRLLALSPAPVEALAAELGFTQATNFVRFFRAHTGATPAAFRRRVGQGVAVA